MKAIVVSATAHRESAACDCSHLSSICQDVLVVRYWVRMTALERNALNEIMTKAVTKKLGSFHRVEV